MSFYRLWAILHKEFRHIYRDKRTLFLVTLSPAIMLLTFSYIFALEVQNVRVGVWDADQTATSRQLIASMTADGKMLRAGTFNSYDTIYQALQRGEIHIGIVIPPGFEAHLIAGERAPLQAIADASDSITVAQTLQRLRERVLAFEQHLNGGAGALMIEVQTQAWFNRELDSMYSMVPGLFPIVMILPMLAIALAITREKELGSFETLATTPIRSVEYLLGKLIPYVTFGLLSAMIAIGVAIFWFHVPLRGSLINLLLMTTLYLCAALGESLFISSFLASQGTAMQIIMLLFFIPSFFMTGIIMPIDSRSGAAQIAAFLLPSTQFVQMTRGVFLKAENFSALWIPTVFLIVLGIVPLALGMLLFRKQVD